MSYGTVRYDDESHHWIIQCAPHVSMRLKRVFGKLRKGSTGKHLLSDTPENARDLAWFMDRYPLTVEKPERLQGQVAAHRERQALVDAILSERYEAKQFPLAVPARHYQSVAAEMLLARGGLLLADDVGLGKTCSGICTLTDPRTLPAVVVTLTHLTRQWRDEINRFAPNLRVHIVKKGQPYDLRPKKKQNSLFSDLPDVIIINYHKLVGWSETLGKLCKSVVFDEVQELRKPESQKYNAAAHISQSVRFRLGLSATPIYNYGAEMHSVLSCLFPDELGSFNEFTVEWCDGLGGSDAKVKNPKAFGSYLRDSGLMLRRTRAEVGREVPPLTVVPHYVASDPEALNLVKSSCAELARLILSEAPDAFRGERMRASEELSNRLRQATGIAKAPYVAEFVRLLIESGEKVVLYGWHREVYNIWNELLKDLNPVFYTGAESVNQKEDSKNRFIKGESNLIIISLRAGAGLDGLQKVSRTVVIGELDWSPGVLEQNIGRVLRDGQQDPVVAYYLLAEDGADPTMSEVLGLKKQQIDGIRQQPGSPDALIEKLQADGSHVRRLAAEYLERNSKR